jgi:uncharacterized protein involved in tellurium resistance
MKLSSWFEFMLEIELNKDIMYGLSEGKKNDYISLCNEFWKLEGEDRNIVLEDLKKDEGILYKKMVEWNENELLIELDMNMVWWEYSLEDYFRDMFDKNGFDKDEFSLFELKDINKMMYGEDYNEDDWE